MGLLDRLERRLQSLVEGGFGRVFGGQLSSAAVVRAVEEAIELRRDSEGAWATNGYEVRLHPQDLQALAERVGRTVQEARHAVRETARQRGWRLAGPVQVRMAPDEDVPRGNVRVGAGLEPGPGEAELVNLRSGERWPLVPRPMWVGREPGLDIVLDHPDVSRRHASIDVVERAYAVTDRASTNSTTVNGQRLSPAQTQDGEVVAYGPVRLADGDIVAFGPVHLQFRER